MDHIKTMTTLTIDIYKNTYFLITVVVYDLLKMHAPDNL